MHQKGDMTLHGRRFSRSTSPKMTDPKTGTRSHGPPLPPPSFVTATLGTVCFTNVGCPWSRQFPAPRREDLSNPSNRFIYFTDGLVPHSLPSGTNTNTY
ncbi:hypothetical protein E2C01_006611 [Portunus trituberculatus]|uniref:Uncharacterized protein n=1 Tax=Portunus trituberculatus TaxID=210409 RepID=A0A5B7CVU5_PORTR|nr:hypothetical protein [Portunus trituberculatus]